MNFLKRQLALLLVLAMTLTMLPMPAHADEVTEPETKSVIVEETTKKTVVSKEEVSTNVAKMPVESAEPDTAAPAAETPADNAADSDATVTEELVTDASEDTEDSKDDIQEETDQAEPETEAPVTVLFSIRKSVANAAATECAHSETEIAWDTKDQVINCKSISDTQHQISGYQYRYCTSCYQRVGESFAATEVASHELDNSGYCSWCGYRSSTGSGSGSDPDSDPDCDHANTAIGWDPDQLGPWYVQYSDTQHKVTGYRYTYCTDCHARIRDESGSNNNYYSEEVEGHTLNASGECTLCGYGQESTCNHLRDSSSGEVSYTDPPRYEQCNEETHYIYRPTYYDCIYCGEPMEEPGYTISNEPHAPENGVCIHCGYEVGEDYCAHLTREFVWDTDHSFTYEQHSDDEHIVRGYKYARCTSCLNRLADSYQSWDYENHSVNASGKCTLCGYESNVETGCTHKYWVYDYSKLDDPPRYEQYDYLKHWVNHNCFKRCVDCGTILPGIEETSSLESHVLNDDGKCTYCGYGFGEDYCTHPASDVMWSNAPMTYTSLDEKQHQVEGCQYHYCTSCYKRISSDFEIVEYENHTFDSAGDCTLCNYRVGCEHKQTTMKLYDTLYEALNKDSHEVTRLYSKACADPECGKVLVSVETSYTETDIEDHDFTGNTCLLCNYTVAAQLSATVTASAQTANKGDHISATATVVGGTGGYRFSWKLLKDGSVVMESSITTSASFGTNASEEGSYVFQVTVTDSGGNTVTAQSGTITVSHGCQYETVTSTELVIQSLTHHTVETTTYEECTICHEKRNEVADVDWVEHTPIDANSYAYESAHPHKKYFICECKAHPYLEGQHETANGTVQEPDVCCICHGHKYGTEEETDEGTRQKTCVNCGLTTVTHTHNFELIETEKLINPDETKHERKTTTDKKCKLCGYTVAVSDVSVDEPHSPKDPKDSKYRTGHPHQRYAVCECGKEFNVPGEYEKVNGKLLEPDICCICHGHKFGEPTVGYGGDWYRICKNCYFTEVTSNPNEPEYIPPENVNTIFCKHEYSCYYDSQMKLHFYCTLCQSRTSAQTAEDEENYKRYIDSQIRATAEDARHKAASFNDEGMYILKALHDENEGFWKDMGTSLYKVYTFQWRDVIYREFGYSENVNEIRKLAIQTAVANTKISQNRSKNTLTVSSHQQVMEDNLEDLPDNIKLVGDFFIDVGDHSNSVAEFLISSDTNTKVSILESIDWKSYTDGVRTGKTKTSSTLVGAKLLLETSLEVGDYVAWSETQWELFYANVNRGTEDIIFLQELMAANPNDKILVQYCEDTIEGIRLKLSDHEFIEAINNAGETAGDLLKIFAVNTGETVADIAMPAALYAGVGFTAGQASIATFAGTVTGFFTELFLGTNTTNDTYDDIEILYEHLVNQIYSYQEIQDDASISDSTKLFQEYYILYLKTAGMELAGELHKGANKHITDGIVSIYEKYEHQMLYE